MAANDSRLAFNLILRYASPVRVISNRRLLDFAGRHPGASEPLQAWRKIVEATNFAHFAALKTSFNGVDRVGGFYVFDIGGNRFRLIAAIHFNRQMLYIRHVFTHIEYERWSSE
jgi:mRNA interferase HigB